MWNTRNALLLCLLLATAACKSSRHRPEETPSAGPAAEPAGAAVPAGEEAQAQDQLAVDVTQLSLAEQRKVFLVDQHLQNARTLLSQLKLDDAIVSQHLGVF